MYRFGTRIQDKRTADEWFLKNMLRIIYSKRFTPEWLLVRRIQAAHYYYAVVSALGDHRFNLVNGEVNEAREVNNGKICKKGSERN
jgi:hypothetical protein